MQAGATWGTVKTAPAVQQGVVHKVFDRTGLVSTSDYQHALRTHKTALLAVLVNTGMAKVTATEIVANFQTYLENVAIFAARNPAITGDAGGISRANAEALSSYVYEALVERHPSLQAIPVVWATVTSTVTTWANICAASGSVTEADGRMTFAGLAENAGMKVQYYPTAIIPLMEGIQRRYEGLRLIPEATAVLERVLTGGQLAIPTNLEANGVLGQVQVLVSLLKRATLNQPVQLLRRDERAVLGPEGGPLPPITQVLALATHAMRAVLTSCLEMSIALGDVRKESVHKGANTPNGTKYLIRADSDFGRLLALALDTSRYYNQTGSKDLAAANAAGARFTIYTLPGWRSMSVSGDTVTIDSASMVLEVETRLRIADINGSDVVDQASTKPGKGVRTPSFNYFMKNPQEIELMAEVVKACGTFDQVAAKCSGELSVRQDTIRRTKAIYEALQDQGYQRFREAIERIAADVAKVSATVTLIHLLRRVTLSLAGASSAGAKVIAEFRD